MNQLEGLLKDSGRLQAMGKKAREVFEENKGAVEKTLKACEDLLREWGCFEKRSNL
ncbi:MAG: hypothetical protein JRI36_14130 [Deltaproteobacteria bacterium]|nr:hypothetical protein [Deltaproteobacteria bacterium]